MEFPLEFPWNKPSSCWGTLILGNPHIYIYIYIISCTAYITWHIWLSGNLQGELLLQKSFATEGDSKRLGHDNMIIVLSLFLVIGDLLIFFPSWTSPPFPNGSCPLWEACRFGALEDIGEMALSRMRHDWTVAGWLCDFRMIWYHYGILGIYMYIIIYNYTFTSTRQLFTTVTDSTILVLSLSLSLLLLELLFLLWLLLYHCCHCYCYYYFH
jgi:hypothetical protein